MANLLKGGWVTPVCIMRERRDHLGHHLKQKDLKVAQKWRSYGQFNNQRLVTQVSIMPDVRDPSGLH